MAAQTIEPPQGFVEDNAPPAGFVEDTTPPAGFVEDKSVAKASEDRSGWSLSERLAGVKDAPGAAMFSTDTLTEPLLNIPHPSIAQVEKFAPYADVSGLHSVLQNTLGEKTTGVLYGAATNALADTAEFFTSKLGIATLGIGALPKVAQKAIAGIFTAQAIYNNPKAVQELIDAPDDESRSKALAHVVENLGMAAGGLTHIGSVEAPIRGSLDEQLKALGPQEIPPPKFEKKFIDPNIIDGLTIARNAMTKDFAAQPEGIQQTRQATIDHIDEQLLSMDKEAVNASSERIAEQQASTPEPATPVASTAEVPAGSPPVESVTPTEVNKAPLETLRSQLSGIVDIPKEEQTLSPEAVAAHASKLPETNKSVVLDVLRDGKTIEEAAANAGTTVAKAHDMVNRSTNFLKQAKTIEPLSARSYEDEPAPQGRPDAPEVEGLKDWTSATEEPAPVGKMKRGGGEAGSISLPKFADRKMSELDRATTERSAKLQKSFDEATRAQKDINRVAPDPKRQNAISVWMEAGGDAAKLADWESKAKGDVFKRAAKDAQTLTPEEIAIAQKAKGAFDVLSQRGQKFDVLKSGRENYVPHVWDAPKSKGGVGSSKLQQNFKFAKARTFENFAEGDAAGFTPKTLAIGKLLPAYLSEMNKVIADRQFVQDLAHSTAEDGRPLATPRGRVSSIDTESGGKAFLANPRAIKGIKGPEGEAIDTMDYRTLENQPALHDWRWENKDENGNPIYMKDDLALHPDAAKRLNSILGKSAIREWYNEPSKGGVVIAKSIAKGIDRAQSLMKREMFSLLAPFHQVQEGWHGVAHRVNPLWDIPKVDLREPAQMDAAKHGLMMLPDRSSTQSYLEGVGAKGSFLTQALRFFGESKVGGNIAGKAATQIANVVDGYQNYLFHQYIPGLKFKTYEAMRERNMEVYDKELKSNQLTESDVKLLSAEQTNAAYGHLNLALLDRNPTMQHLLQLSLLAPDFLEARGRFVGQAVKGLLGSKVGQEQFKAIATIAAVQAASAYVLTKLGGDEWDAKHPFEVVHGGRRYTLRSVPEDIASLISDPRQFIYGRVNPLNVKGGIQLATGLNYRGEKTTALQTVEELLAQYIPITARAIPGIRSLTETSRQSPLSPLEQLAGSLGVRISRKSPITDTYKTASDWMEKQGVAKDKGSYPVSKFQQLRYALEDGDLDKAGREYDKLSEGTTKAKLAQAFRASVNHPFTKSTQMDNQFRASLGPKERAVFDLAQGKRKQILSSFNSLHSAGTKASEKR